MNEGEIVSLIGSNGAGKSTLLMTISGVNKAKRGNIVFKVDKIENKQSSSDSNGFFIEKIFFTKLVKLLFNKWNFYYFSLPIINISKSLFSKKPSFF